MLILDLNEFIIEVVKRKLRLDLGISQWLLTFDEVWVIQVLPIFLHIVVVASASKVGDERRSQLFRLKCFPGEASEPGMLL